MILFHVTSQKYWLDSICYSFTNNLHSCYALQSQKKLSFYMLNELLYMCRFVTSCCWALVASCLWAWWRFSYLAINPFVNSFFNLFFEYHKKSNICSRPCNPNLQLWYLRLLREMLNGRCMTLDGAPYSNIPTTHQQLLQYLAWCCVRFQYD